YFFCSSRRRHTRSKRDRSSDVCSSDLAEQAIVSMAGEGTLLFTANGVYHGRSPKGEVQNSVGAGDSMIAGFTGKYNETKDAVEAFRMDLAAGSATAFSADLATAETIYALRDEISITRIS